MHTWSDVWPSALVERVGLRGLVRTMERVNITPLRDLNIYGMCVSLLTAHMGPWDASTHPLVVVGGD